MKSIASVSKNSPCICPEKEPIWRTIRARTAFFAVLAGLLSMGSFASAQTGGIFEVGKYDDPDGGHPEPERCRGSWLNDAPAFYYYGRYLRNSMDDWGYDWTHRIQNMGVDDNDFITKTSTYSWPHDYGSNSFDGAQVVFYMGHGSMRTQHEWDDLWYPAANWDDGARHGMHDRWGPGGPPNDPFNATRYTSGDKDTDHPNGDGCYPVTSNPNFPDLYMMLGGGYVPTPPDQEGNVVVALHWGCRQAYYWVWADSGFDSVREGEMGMWNGWHSHGQFGNGWYWDFTDYVEIAMRFGGAGECWVDMTRLHSTCTQPYCHRDHCLASVVWGTDLYDILNRFEDSRLAGEDNLPSVSNPNYSMYFFYGGCTPYPDFDSNCDNQGWGAACGPDGLVLPGDRNGLMTYEFKNGS